MSAYSTFHFHKAPRKGKFIEKKADQGDLELEVGVEEVNGQRHEGAFWAKESPKSRLW